MAATKLSFFVISTSDRGDFPRIIEIALFHIMPICFDTSSSLKQNSSVRPRTARTLENVATVRASVQKCPRRLIFKCSRILEFPTEFFKEFFIMIFKCIHTTWFGTITQRTLKLEAHCVWKFNNKENNCRELDGWPLHYCLKVWL